MVACTCNITVFFITVSVCCGITGIGCCCRGHFPPIPYYRRNRIYPVLLIPPQSEMIQETQKVVLVTNPHQTEVFIGFPYTN
jgi:hypothetical protein